MTSDPSILTILSIAEGAFVNAVVKTLKTQDEILQLRQRLEFESNDAERSNDAVFKERGFNEATPFDELLDAQEKYMKAAFERSGLAPDNPIIKMMFGQLTDARKSYEEYVTQQGAAGMQGPEL